MAELVFEQLRFNQMDTDGRHMVRVFFCGYHFDIDIEELSQIGTFNVREHSIEFPGLSEKKAQKKFQIAIDNGFDRLINPINSRKVVYVHANSGIPLIGSNYFGIIDRNTNLIEIRPLTGCNLDCIYCSVAEGPSYKKEADYLVDINYMLEGLRDYILSGSLADVEIHINAQGEPMLYPWTMELIKGARAIKGVVKVSMDTNGTLLTEKRVALLEKAGLSQLNLSVNALDNTTCEKLAVRPYSLDRIMSMMQAIEKSSISLLLAPVWLKGLNDSGIEALVAYAKQKGLVIGIQNYQSYKLGRRAKGLKEMSMDEFYSKLRVLEKKHGIRLVLDPVEDFSIKKSVRRNAYKKDDVLKVSYLSAGRKKNEILAKAGDYIVTVSGVDPKSMHPGKQLKAKITRAKHNIFYASVC